MPTQARKHRGAATELLVERYWRDHGYPAATVRRGAGTDLRNTGRVCVEIKARTGFAPGAWIRQATANTPLGGLALVVIRPNGMGEMTLDDWPVMMRHSDVMTLLGAAGLTLDGVI
jgi:hypothetical protein